MTKERKLAIQMWQGIKDTIIHYHPYMSTINIQHYKAEFCARHNLSWYLDCWFCQYIPCCHYCPLRTCSHSSVYYIACTPWVNKETRLEACDKIIAALKGEYKYESR